MRLQWSHDDRRTQAADTRVRPALAALLCAALVTAPLRGAERGFASDSALKAAIILNIIRFVDFGMSGATEPLLLCVNRASSAARAIAALDGKRVGARAIVTRELAPAMLGECDVVYLGAGNAAAIARMRRIGVLLIGEGPDFIEAGGTIGLVGAGTQMRFEANTRAAGEARIKLSSKLLRLATRVR